MNKGILKMTTEAVKNILKIDEDMDIMGADFEIDRGVVKLLLTTDNKDKLFKVTQAQQIPTVILEEVSNEPCLYDSILKENMSYGEAQDAISAGHCVARKIWKGYWYQEDITGFAHPVIVAKLKGTGEKVIATPYQEDRFANDWMIVVPKQLTFSAKSKNIERYIATEKEVKELPYVVREFLVELFSGKKADEYVTCEDKEKFTPRWLFYLVSRELVTVLPFAEAQIMSCRLTTKGQAFLKKIRELNLA